MIALVIQVIQKLISYRCCGNPYRAPTPTRGKKLTTFFTVARSLNANITLAKICQNNQLFSQKNNFSHTSI